MLGFRGNLETARYTGSYVEEQWALLFKEGHQPSAEHTAMTPRSNVCFLHLLSRRPFRAETCAPFACSTSAEQTPDSYTSAPISQPRTAIADLQPHIPFTFVSCHSTRTPEPSISARKSHVALRNCGSTSTEVQLTCLDLEQRIMPSSARV